MLKYWRKKSFEENLGRKKICFTVDLDMIMRD